MRKIVCVCFAIFYVCSSYAQEDWRVKSDSLSYESRRKADIVLSEFDTIVGKKMLYSIRDIYYYIIISTGSDYKEYVLVVDSNSKIEHLKEVYHDKEIRKLKAKICLSKSNRKSLKRLEDDRLMIKGVFDTSLYHTEFITYVPNATVGSISVLSYFVLKDENNNRYGEYSLSSMTMPLPINHDLWAYLYRNIAENRNKFW